MKRPFLKLANILTILFLPNLFIPLISMKNMDAGNDYLKALMEISKVSPNGDEVEEGLAQGEKPDVEFSKDMKFFSVTLKDSIILALKNNYDIKIAKLGPIIKERDITAAKSVFDPVLKVTGSRGVSETPTVNKLTTGEVGDEEVIGITEFKQDINDVQAAIEKTTVTGATFTLDFNLGIRSFIDPSPFSPLNPQSTASIGVKITQPLLRNAGIFYNRSEIYIERNNKRKSILELKGTAITVVNDVQKAYWELVKAIEDLKVKNKSLERARDLLRKNKIQVEVGTMAPIEVIEAEEGVASQLEAVIVSENEIKNNEDDLKQVMNLSGNSILSDVSIVPLDKATFELTDVILDESIKAALENRPELLEQGIDIENSNIEVKQRRNELLPKLDLEAGIRYSGLGGNSGNAIDSSFSEDFQSEFFGVTLEVPLGNRKARSNYSKAKLEVLQSVLDRKKLEQKIVVEVRKAVREIKTNIGRIKATKKANELAQKRLEAEDKKFKVGRSTSLEVLRAQEDLVEAEGNAINAIVDYQISLGELDAVQGTILDKNNIVIDDNDLVLKENLTQEGPS